MQYNQATIKKAIQARKRVAKACRACALKYSPVPLPDSVIHRICTRRKLYNFLEALGENIPAIMHAYDLSVPRDRALKQTSLEPKKEPKPRWLDQLNVTDEF